MSKWNVQYCKITLASFHCRLWYSFFSFQSVKLNAIHTEASHFIKNIRVEELLGEHNAELSELHKTEVFDSCEVCKEVFSRTSYILGHTSARGRQTLSRCETCVTSSTHKRSAIEGMSDRVRRFSCDVCKRRFTSRSNLDYHTRVRTWERPFVCKVCKKEFTQCSSLKRHLRIHTGERPFSCKMCRKGFTHLSNLRGISHCIVKRDIFRAMCVSKDSLSALT
jgi:hypothetical protein